MARAGKATLRCLREEAASAGLGRAPRQFGKHLRPAWRSEARREFPVRFWHRVWQVGGAEQAGFEDFLRVEGQAV